MQRSLQTRASIIFEYRNKNVILSILRGKKRVQTDYLSAVYEYMNACMFVYFFVDTYKWKIPLCVELLTTIFEYSQVNISIRNIMWVCMFLVCFFISSCFRGKQESWINGLCSPHYYYTPQILYDWLVVCVLWMLECWRNRPSLAKQNKTERREKMLFFFFIFVFSSLFLVFFCWQCLPHFLALHDTFTLHVAIQFGCNSLFISQNVGQRQRSNKYEGMKMIRN